MNKTLHIGDKVKVKVSMSNVGTPLNLKKIYTISEFHPKNEVLIEDNFSNYFVNKEDLIVIKPKTKKVKKKVDWNIDVRYEPDILKAFDKFIEKWCGENSAHLLDSDEQDGEFMRDKIRTLLATKSQPIKEEKKIPTGGGSKPNGSGGGCMATTFKSVKQQSKEIKPLENISEDIIGFDNSIGRVCEKRMWDKINELIEIINSLTKRK